MWDKHYREDIEAHNAPDAAIPITEARNLEAWLKTLNEAMGGAVVGRSGAVEQNGYPSAR